MRTISSVFTPRSQTVNPITYVPRPDLERNIGRWTSGAQHGWIVGESGNGKSWLYKHVFGQHKLPYATINCGLISSKNNLWDALIARIQEEGHVLIGQKDIVEAKGGIPGLASGKGAFEKQYNVLSKDTQIQVCHLLCKKYPILVFDNVERIFSNSELMKELGDFLLMVDDEYMFPSPFKCLLISTPVSLIDYYSSEPNHTTISNRIHELPRVSGLTDSEIGQLIKKGFVDSLNVNLDPENIKEITAAFNYYTLGNSQSVQEICLNLAYVLEDSNWKFSLDMVNLASKKWMHSGMRSSYSVIQNNWVSTRGSGRKNQILYVLGKFSSHLIKGSDVEREFEIAFPSTRGTNINCYQYLNQLVIADMPVIRKSTIPNTYTIIDPKYLMVIRISIRISGEDVSLIPFSI